MAKKRNDLYFKILPFIAFSTAVLMTIFETAKQFIHADITIWESHIATILFTMIVSVVLTYSALQRHHSVLRVLSGFISMCAWCKKIRDENGAWVTFDVYVGKHSTAEFSHGICPDCEVRFKKKSQEYRDAHGVADQS
ncbi:MAG: hypothetical protein WCW40_00285 [Bacteroidota bacterium]